MRIPIIMSKTKSLNKISFFFHIWSIEKNAYYRKNARLTMMGFFIRFDGDDSLSSCSTAQRKSKMWIMKKKKETVDVFSCVVHDKEKGRSGFILGFFLLSYVRSIISIFIFDFPWKWNLAITWIHDDSLNIVKIERMKWTIKSCVCVCTIWWPQCSKIDCTIIRFQDKRTHIISVKEKYMVET